MSSIIHLPKAVHTGVPFNSPRRTAASSRTRLEYLSLRIRKTWRNLSSSILLPAVSRFQFVSHGHLSLLQCLNFDLALHTKVFDLHYGACGSS